ncbi:unnamed protein product [Symbiodinium sp. CCMP2592]|nr:unnamed protein product [Symbiodinium sp. CCMP2592]
MECYDDQVSKMSVLAKFLRERHSKERLLAKCFSQGVQGEAVFKEAVAKFRSQCYRARWGTVASCALDLQEVLPSLRWGWSLPKYLDGGAVAGQGEAEGASIADVDALVRCPFFEAYLSMLVLLSEVTLHLIAWSESCPCHWHLLTGGGSNALDASTRCLLETCPMRGRRAPELALNDFMQELSALSSHGATSLVQNFPPDLPAEERTKVVQDFEMGLAHHDQERAREVWNRIRCLSEEGPEAVRLRKHLPRLFSPDVLQQGDQWCCGADLTSCPLFAAEVAGLALIPTAERRVESQHARTQKGSKKSPCHSPAYMSLQIRAKDLREAMCGNPKDFVAQLAPCVNQCRSYKKAVQAMRLGLHPAAAKGSSAVRDRRLRDLLYRADMLSQHQNMPEVFVRDPATNSARRPAPPTAEEHAVEATALGPILKRLALEHVLDRLPVVRNSGEPVVFAVAYESGAFSLLREFLLPSQQQPMPMLTYSSPEVVASEDIVEISGPGPRREVDVLFQKISQAEATHHQMTGVFFKLLPSMSKMKRFQADGELRLSSTDLPIALLRAASFSQERRELLVDSELLNMRSAVRGLAVDDIPCVLSFSSLSLSQLKSLRVLKVDPSIVYCLRACQDYSPPLSDSRALRVVLEKIFLKGKAGVTDTSSFTAEQRSLLLPLQQNGLLTEDPPFKLTDKGLRHVCLANAVTQPRLLLAKLPVPPVEQSKWQLLQTLLDNGWEARACRASQCRKAESFDHRAAAPDSKILFLVQQKSGVVVDRLYLLALTLAVQHELQPVPHGRSADVYRRLLAGVPDLALPEPRAPRARVRAFRAIADGDEWLDHVPVPVPARKKRRVKQQRQQHPQPLPEGGAHPHPAVDDIGDASPVDAALEDAQDGPDGSDDAGDVDELLRMIDEIDEDEVAAEVETEAAEAAAEAVAGDNGGGVAAILQDVLHPVHAAEPNSGSSGSTSESDSSTGSSDSSSGSGDSSGSGSGSGSLSTGSGATDGAPVPAPKAKAKAKAKSKAKGKAKARAGLGGALGPLTFFWRGCKFTPIKGSDGTTTGYEATCKHEAHEQCRRTLLFSAHGGEDNTLLKLKWWCLEARHYPDRRAHVHRCPYNIRGAAPTAAQLDAQSFDSD